MAQILNNPGYTGVMNAVGVDNNMLFEWIQCKEIYIWNMIGGWVWDGRYRIGYERSWRHCRSYIPFNWERPVVALTGKLKYAAVEDIIPLLDWLSNHFQVTPFGVKVASIHKNGTCVYQFDMDEYWFRSPVSVSLILSLLRIVIADHSGYKDGYKSNMERLTGPFIGNIPMSTDPYASRSVDVSYLVMARSNGNLQKLVDKTLPPVNNPQDWRLRSPNYNGVRNVGIVDWRPSIDGPPATPLELEMQYGLNTDRPSY